MAFSAILVLSFGLAVDAAAVSAARGALMGLGFKILFEHLGAA